ncbi:type II toxin-antitoxin system HicB family antitoxin [Desulfonatronovibrio magnus]|uniref:type II toxin-antitoxin system HicB family antitoxin n=1 Tax=Desulfonatronovibrio magnus TaxID=698827 RepID=UPI0005EB5C20|nr:type II toxin-antitoxin system HicB family antitoxin [Desulfonatronovibrio magnus]
MKIQTTIQIWQKQSWYIATCPELDFISQGQTKDEARANLMEVIDIQFEEMAELGTLYGYLEECGYIITDDNAISQFEMIGFEKLDMQVQQ